MSHPLISIIIPTLNEEKYIGRLLTFLDNHSQNNRFEVIVSDGGSSDTTRTIAKKFNCRLIETTPSRALQMNVASRQAKGDVLYFVHADVGLVSSFPVDIETAVKEGYRSGCYRGEFVDPSLSLLKINAWFTKFPFRWCRGGDQTLFITKDFFDQLGGYDDKAVIMEDYFLIDKLLEDGRFKLIPKNVKISARKYKSNSYLRVQLANLRAMKMYRRGEATEKIHDFYSKTLR